jgi:hypothetical protein
LKKSDVVGQVKDFVVSDEQHFMKYEKVSDIYFSKA